MKRKPAAGFKGRWRIAEMDMLASDDLGLAESAHLSFGSAAAGDMAFGALSAVLDVRYGARDGAACAEFAWQGFDEGDSVSGRGWAALGTAGRLVGHIFVHNGDDSGFVAERQ